MDGCDSGDGGMECGRREVPRSGRPDPAKNVPRVLSVIRFGKYLFTDIFYDLCFRSRNICKQIFQNGYFSLLYVICLQRLQKTDKLATENRYCSKKRWSVSHRPGTTQTVHPKLEKKYTFSVFYVEQRHSLSTK
jgi:hypothetical protein